MDEWEVLEENYEYNHGADDKVESQVAAQRAMNSVQGKATHPASCPTSAHGKAITKEMVIRALEKKGARLGSTVGQADDAMAKATHLHLNGMRITHISHLKGLPSLETLYLYENQIECIEGLERLQNLTHLYLQDNHITHISGLDSLTNLQKLYLAGNHISYVSGLRGLISLEELHISNQKLQPGQAMEFDPASIAEVAPSLRVLAAINCNLQDSSLPVLSQLGELRRLQLGSNNLTSMDALDEALRGMPRLMALELKGNPLARGLRYKEQVVVMSDSLQSLDDELIPAQQRENLMRLQLKKMKAALATEQGTEAGGAVSSHQPHAGAMAQGIAQRPVHRMQRNMQPPPTAGFGAPRHLAKQTSGSSRTRAQPTIPGRGDAENVSLGMQGMQLGQ